MTRANEIVGSPLRTAALPVALLLATLVHPALVDAQTASTLTVNVSALRNAQGKVMVAVYKDAAGFPDTPKVAFRKELVDIDAKALTAKAVFPDMPHGSYAVAVLHDENGNGDMDKNMLGIPKEGHGASKNPEPMMRAPKFEEAQFSMTAPATLEIKTFY
jgi:uncharacterized protein (DUF2141 family)